MESTIERPLTMKEASEFLRITKAGVYKLVRQGKLRAYKPNNGMVYFKRSDLENYVYNSDHVK